MRELLQAVGEDIWAQTNWQACSREALWTSLAGADQGALDTLFPEDMAHIIPQTFWDKTARQPMFGPVSDYNWQTEQAYSSASPSYYFRVAGGRLWTQASMPAGHSLSLLYKSKRWITSAGVGKTTFVTDDDTCVFSDALMKKGLRAFWLRVKQMPHRYEFEAYDIAKAQEAASNTVAPIIYLDGTPNAASPGIIIPRGNWIV
jgi:hypothetical protein